MNRLAVVIGTWFGCGYWPWGPGTAGSLAAVLIAALLHFRFGLDRMVLLVFIFILLWPAIWASTRTAKLVGRTDPGLVVVDEVLGQWVALLGAAILDWKTLACAFVLFRIFDMWKPWPVRGFEKLPDGLGIVADDLAAGVYSAAFLYAGRALKIY